MLKRHDIPLDVLDSYESASAAAGDNANIAKLLLETGLLGDVGMSFKIAISSVAVFLDHFYKQLP